MDTNNVASSMLRLTPLYHILLNIIKYVICKEIWIKHSDNTAYSINLASEKEYAQ